MKLPDDIESLQSLLREVFVELSALKEEITKLWKENTELRRRLGRNYGNSHQPPSSDGYKKKKIVTTLPKAEGKRCGGQIGHHGKNLEQVDKADKVVVHHAEACCCGGRQFSEQEAYVLLPNR